MRRFIASFAVASLAVFFVTSFQQFNQNLQYAPSERALQQQLYNIYHGLRNAIRKSVVIMTNV